MPTHHTVPLRLRIKPPDSSNPSIPCVSSDPILSLAQLGPDLWIRSQAARGPRPVANSFKELAQNCSSNHLTPPVSASDQPIQYPTNTSSESSIEIVRVSYATPRQPRPTAPPGPSTPPHQSDIQPVHPASHAHSLDPPISPSTLERLTHRPRPPNSRPADSSKSPDGWSAEEDAALWKILRRKNNMCSEWDRVESYMTSLGFQHTRRAYMKRARLLKEEWTQGKRPEWSHFPPLPAMHRSKNIYGHRSWTAEEEEAFLRCLGRKAQLRRKASLALVEKWMAESGFPRTACALSQRIPKLMKDAEKDGEGWTQRLTRYGRLSRREMLFKQRDEDASSAEESEGEAGEDSGRTELRIEGEGDGDGKGSASVEADPEFCKEEEIDKDKDGNEEEDEDEDEDKDQDEDEDEDEDEKMVQNENDSEWIGGESEDNGEDSDSGLENIMNRCRERRLLRRRVATRSQTEADTCMEDEGNEGMTEEGAQREEDVRMDEMTRNEEAAEREAVEASMEGAEAVMEEEEGSEEVVAGGCEESRWSAEEDEHLMRLLGLRMIWGWTWEEVMEMHRDEGGFNRTVWSCVERSKVIRCELQRDGKDWDTEVKRLGDDELEKRRANGMVGENGYRPRASQGKAKRKKEGARKFGVLWDEEEDKLLRRLVERKKRTKAQWSELPAWLKEEGGGDRSSKACMIRWCRLRNGGRRSRKCTRGRKRRDDGNTNKKNTEEKEDGSGVSARVEKKKGFYDSLSERESDEESLGGIEISEELGEISTND